MEKKKFFSAKNVATLGVLLALTIVLQLFASSITIGPVSLNFALIPIVLAAVVLGPWEGMFMGLACGVVVLFQVIFPAGPAAAFYTAIWTNDPVVTAITCLVKTTAAGLLAGFLFRWIEKKNRYVAVFVASGIVPIVNTGLFILGCLGMVNSVYAMAGGENVLVFILVGLVTFNFFIEFGINLIVAPGIHTVYKVVEKKFSK